MPDLSEHPDTLSQLGNDLDFLSEYGRGFTPDERLSLREARNAMWRMAKAKA